MAQHLLSLYPTFMQYSCILLTRRGSLAHAYIYKGVEPQRHITNVPPRLAEDSDAAEFTFPRGIVDVFMFTSCDAKALLTDDHMFRRVLPIMASRRPPPPNRPKGRHLWCYRYVMSYCRHSLFRYLYLFRYLLHYSLLQQYARLGRPLFPRNQCAISSRWVLYMSFSFLSECLFYYVFCLHYFTATFLPLTI